MRNPKVEIVLSLKELERVIRRLERDIRNGEAAGTENVEDVESTRKMIARFRGLITTFG